MLQGRSISNTGVKCVFSVGVLFSCIESQFFSTLLCSQIDVDFNGFDLYSAFPNVAVQPVLDPVIDYLPAPTEVPPARGTHPHKGDAVERAPDPGAPHQR